MGSPPLYRRVFAIILAPLSLLYGLVISLRNFMYEIEIIKPTNFSIPIIGVGNLAIGGAGKTPHIEYLIRILDPYINVATLSRGYNRNTTGFRMVSHYDEAISVGDEPLMYARKFNQVPVAVCENRALAIPQLVGRYPDLQTILLDDAFQHRSVKPYLNILLTQYDHMYVEDWLLPSGRLREWRSAYVRADIIIVTKCPQSLTQEEKKHKVDALKPYAYQRIFFSTYAYQPLYHFYQPQYRMRIKKTHDVILISAIANTDYLEKYISEEADRHLALNYEDHHNYTQADINNIIDLFKKRESPIKYIVTTEKDAVRLMPFRQQLYDHAIPIFVLPIQVVFLDEGGQKFDNLIKERLLAFES